MKRITFVFLIMFVCTVTTALAQNWSPQTADLLFMSNKDGNGEIYVQKGGTKEWVNLTNNPVSDNWPVWSPDGRRIVFQRRDSTMFDVWVMNADGSNQTRLTDDPDHDYIPSWSHDGKQITFTSWRREPADTGRAPHIYIMNADGSNQRRLVGVTLNTSAGAEWSPDGKYIVYSRRVRGEGADLFMAESNGKNERRLTDSDSYYGSPVFSPDGSKLAFYFDAGSSAQIVVMNLDGSGRKVLVAEGYNWYPKWSPDGKWITYTAYAPGENKQDLDIYAVSVNGKEAPVRIAVGPNRESESSWKPTR